MRVQVELTGYSGLLLYIKVFADYVLLYFECNDTNQQQRQKQL